MSKKHKALYNVVINRPRLTKALSPYNVTISAYDFIAVSEGEEEAIYWLLKVREVGNTKKQRGICLVVNISVEYRRALT